MFILVCHCSVSPVYMTPSRAARRSSFFCLWKSISRSIPEGAAALS
ncbi:hypothetical protein AD15_4196 [Escherichia coli 3-105-05_S4_C2]|nr:hypothetical protein AD15_4196 [Escherichia coli 3-105-05_S4_C2]